MLCISQIMDENVTEGMYCLTSRREANDRIRANDVVRPPLATGLHFAHVVFLRVVEVVALVIVAGEGLLQWYFARA